MKTTDKRTTTRCKGTCDDLSCCDVCFVFVSVCLFCFVCLRFVSWIPKICHRRRKERKVKRRKKETSREKKEEASGKEVRVRENEEEEKRKEENQMTNNNWWGDENKWVCKWKVFAHLIGWCESVCVVKWCFSFWRLRTVLCVGQDSLVVWLLFVLACSARWSASWRKKRDLIHEVVFLCIR